MVYEFGQTETENITTIAKIDAERESDQDRAWRLERAAMPKICYCVVTILGTVLVHQTRIIRLLTTIAGE